MHVTKIKGNKFRIVFVVDLDHTLTGTNTTFEFLSILCRIRYFIFSKLLKLLFLLNVIFGQDIYKLVLIFMCIRGQREEELKLLARRYYESAVKRRPEAYLNSRLLFFLRKIGPVPKILLTASLDFIAVNFKELGFNAVISSRSYYKDGKFYHFYDLYRRKSYVLRIILRYFDKVVVFDDNPEPEFYMFGDRVTIIRVPAYGTKH